MHKNLAPVSPERASLKLRNMEKLNTGPDGNTISPRNDQEAGMTTRRKSILLTVCIALLVMLVPGAARSQGQQEPPASPATASPQSEASVSTGPEATPAPAAAETNTPYIIKKGDTLWDISNTFFKDPFLWPFIWKANPYVTNPDLIFTGNTLMIPSLTPIERALKAEAAPSETPVEKKGPAPEAATPGAATPKKSAEAVEETADRRVKAHYARGADLSTCRQIRNGQRGFCEQ